MSEESAESTETAEAPESTPAESLIDGAAPELSEGEFFLAADIKGIGDIPEYFDSKRFKTVSDQAKSYLELEKKFGSFTGQPKDGYIFADDVDKADPLIQEIINFGESTNLNQEGANKLFELATSLSGVSEEISAESEMKKLGDNAETKIKSVETFLKGKLSPDDYEAIKPLVSSADSINLLATVMKAVQPVQLPIDGGESPTGETWADIEKMMFAKDSNGQLLRSVDAKYNKQVNEKMKAFGGHVGVQHRYS